MKARASAELDARVHHAIDQAIAEHTSAATGHRWKTALILVGLLCAGAAATEIAVQVHRYYFQGKDSDGLYHFSTAPETVYEGTHVDENGVTQYVKVARGGLTTVGSRGADGQEVDVDRARRDLEEIDLLRQADARELVSVTDTEVNGNFIGRAFVFKYTLADGRTQSMGEAGFERPPISVPQQAKDQQEIAELRRRGQRDVVKIIDTDLEGIIQRTLICRYVLSDGREVTMGEGDPALAAPAKTLTPGQDDELRRLVSLGKGELVGTVEAPLFGKTFTFEQRLFKLSDGTLVTHSEGEPQGPKTGLSKADWKELRELISAGAGERLETYDEEVRGKILQFTRVKYILRDGTEVVQSCGVPSGKE